MNYSFENSKKMDGIVISPQCLQEAIPNSQYVKLPYMKRDSSPSEEFFKDDSGNCFKINSKTPSTQRNS